MEHFKSCIRVFYSFCLENLALDRRYSTFDILVIVLASDIECTRWTLDFINHSVLLCTIAKSFLFHFHKHSVKLSHFRDSFLVASQDVLVVAFLLFATFGCPLVQRWSLGCINFVNSIRIYVICDVRSIKFL